MKVEDILNTQCAHIDDVADKDWWNGFGTSMIRRIIEGAEIVWELINWDEETTIKHSIIFDSVLTDRSDNDILGEFSDEISKKMMSMIVNDITFIAGRPPLSDHDVSLNDLYNYFNNVMPKGFDWIIVPDGYQGFEGNGKYGVFEAVNLYIMNINCVLFGNKADYSFRPLSFEWIGAPGAELLKMNYLKSCTASYQFGKVIIN